MLICHKCLKSINNSNSYGLHHQCFTEWFLCPQHTKFTELIPQNIVSNEPSKGPSSFFHGKFKKYIAKLDGKKYVLKVLQEEYPHLPQVEYISNQIAQSLKLKTPNFYFIKLEDKDCFVSRDFLDGTRWQKLTHIYHYLPKESEFDVETLSNTIFKITTKPQDVSLFFETLLFDSLIGNHDRHGRNLGILSRGKISRLAPIYDNPSYIGIEDLLGSDLNPTGKIFTKHSTEPSMKDYVIELKRLNAEKILKSFKRRCSLSVIHQLISQSVLNERVKEAMIKLITKRYEEFIKNL